MVADRTVPSRARRGWKWGLALVAIIGLSLAGAQRAMRPPEVPVGRVVRARITQSVVANGRVLPPSLVSLGSLMAGSVSDVKVEEGAHVEAGALLVQLQDTELRAALSQAKALAAQSNARLEQLSLVIDPLAREDVRKAAADLEKAEADLTRATSLFETGAITKSQLEDAQKARDSAKSASTSAVIRARGNAPGGIEARLSRTSVLHAEGAVGIAEAHLAESRLTAPSSGTILVRSVEPGDVVQPGKQLLVLARDGETRLLIQPDERNLALIKLGQRARATTEAFADQVFDAEVAFIAPMIDPTRGTVDVKLKVGSPPKYLRANMTVSVTILVGEKDSALLVPPDAVRDGASAAPFLLVVRSGITQRAPVKLGLRNDRNVEIVSGASEGDVVVLASAGVTVAGKRVRAKAE